MAAKFEPKVQVRLTRSQKKDLFPLFWKVREEDGSAVFAQVWPDGIRAYFLTKEQVSLWQKTVGIKGSRNSAFDRQS